MSAEPVPDRLNESTRREILEAAGNLNLDPVALRAAYEHQYMMSPGYIGECIRAYLVTAVDRAERR